MPAYNFKRQFALAVKYGEKRQTIRKVRKRGNPEPGDTLYLYTGMRSKKCWKLGEHICTSVQQVEIPKVFEVIVDGNRLGSFEIWDLAAEDGLGYREFFKFFDDLYGLPFNGILIKW